MEHSDPSFKNSQVHASERLRQGYFFIIIIYL